MSREKTLKGSVCIGRPQGGRGDDVIKIEIQDENSNVRFLTLNMKPADFALALTGLSFVPVEFSLNHAEYVGLIKERKPGRLIVPKSEHHYYSREELRQMVRDQCQEEGWFLDDYLGSQSSIGRDKDGNTIVNFGYYRYVEETSHA